MISDKGISAAQKYNFEILNTQKGRGNIVCSTTRGLVVIKEVKNISKIEFQNKVQSLAKDNGFCNTDIILENLEGNLVTENREDIPYIIKNWYDGREIDVKNETEILMAVKAMARIHKKMYLKMEDVLEDTAENLINEFERHNRELKKIRTFIRNKNRKTDYELAFLAIYQVFLEEGEKALKRIENSDYLKLRQRAIENGEICHGDFNQHNVIITGGRYAIINYDKCRYSIQMNDLYNFMRKILEKNQWNVKLGEKMINEYASEKIIDEYEMENLFIRFLYPDKFWKVANRYYNTSKAWTPIKNIEKLQTIVWQNAHKHEFIKTVFKDFV